MTNRSSMHEVNFGLNVYCGPAVLSALTGKSTDECAGVIAGISGQSQISAVQLSHLLLALKKLRFNTEVVNPVSSYLFGNLMGLTNYPDAIYIVMVPKHFIAVEVKDKRVYIVDNHSKSPLPAESSSRLLQKVTHIYRAVPMPQPVFVRTEYQMSRIGRTFVFHAYDIFERSEDNITRTLGHISNLKDDNELNEVMKALRHWTGLNNHAS